VIRWRLWLVAPLVLACAGPRPSVERVVVHSGPTYAVLVTVANHGGRGQAEITARLVDTTTHRTAAQITHNIDLDRDETIDVPLSLTPTQPGAYRAVVEVHYPIE